MELPQHWVTADGFSPHLGQGGGTLTVWGWSSESEADAARVAQTRLAEALERVAREGGLPPGHGYYPRVPMREPVLEEVDAASGAQLGVVTRNRMGCEVLCTDLLFIADVDVPELEHDASRRATGGAGGGSVRSRDAAVGSGRGSDGGTGGGGIGGFFRRLLSGEPAPTPMAPTAPEMDEQDAGADETEVGSPLHAGASVAETLACEPAWEFARRHPDLGVRVYRTAAGLRVLVTGASARPSSDRARSLLTELGADPLYVELCATHDSYRARLTPKPFRVGESALSVSWPFADDAAREAHAEWVSEYDGRASGHAVCRLLGTSGPDAGPDEQRLVSLHDARCRVGERLPLA